MAIFPQKKFFDLCDKEKPDDKLKLSRIYINPNRKIITSQSKNTNINCTKIFSKRKIIWSFFYEIACTTLNVIAVASFVAETLLMIIIFLHVLGLERYLN